MKKIVFVILLTAFVVIGYMTIKEIKVNYFKGGPTSITPTLTLEEVNDKVFGGNKDASIKIIKSQGKITATDILPPPPQVNPINYFSFKLQTDKEVLNFLFLESELKNIKMVDLLGKTISYKDLKVGQNISVIQKYNPTDSSYFEGEIKILQ